MSSPSSPPPFPRSPCLSLGFPPYNTPAPLSCSLSHTLPDTPHAAIPSHPPIPSSLVLLPLFHNDHPQEKARGRGGAPGSPERRERRGRRVRIEPSARSDYISQFLPSSSLYFTFHLPSFYLSPGCSALSAISCPVSQAPEKAPVIHYLC